jgi:salicylate hydroxylase
MPLAGQPVTVLGGGVGGLAAALALARRGAQVTVLEQAPAIAEVGAGLQISPNGAVVLRALGLGTELARAGIRALRVELREHRRGACVLRFDLDRRPRPAGHYLVHRADLIALLERAARTAGVEVVTGAQVLRAQPGAHGARLEMADGTARHATLLIGADGMRSVLRAALNAAEAPFFTRQVAWRAIIPETGAPEPVTQVFMAPGRHLVSYPLRGGTRRNIAAFEERPEWAEEGWHQTGDVAAFRRAFAGIGGPVPGWLGQVESVHLWGLFRHRVAPVWQAGRCALLGDAAHPTLPFMGQGANMALEDAWVLAAALDAHATPEAGLAAYAAARTARCARIVATADGNARLYHLSGPARPLVQAVMGLGGALLPGFAPSRFDWLHGHDVTTATP